MSILDARAEAVREFNRFYTTRIGALAEGHLGSNYSLAEVRVMYEVAHRERPTASDLADALAIDRGYLSRILSRFRARGLVSVSRSEADARRRHLTLTAAGRRVFAPLDDRARENIAAMLRPLTPSDQTQVVTAMQSIRRALSRDAAAPGSEYTLRSHEPGDMGWVVQRHGELYWQEYRYDERFEALVARVVADFIDHLDPDRERCWIAERSGERVGSVFLVRKSRTIAKLRLLLVEPGARGGGLGRRLVNECVQFARSAGYRSVMLWTQSELVSARKIYVGEGFRLVAEEPHSSWSRTGLVAETWRLDF